MTRIVVSLAEETTAATLARMGELADVADVFEVRADLVRNLDLDALLRSRTKPLLLTCRAQSEGGGWPDGDGEGRRRLLREAVERGVDMVDVKHRAGFADAAAGAGREVAPGQPPAAVLERTYRVRTVGPATRVYGLLGSDVLRSPSPAIHNRAFAERGIDAVYVPLPAGSPPPPGAPPRAPPRRRSRSISSPSV